MSTIHRFAPFLVCLLIVTLLGGCETLPGWLSGGVELPFREPEGRVQATDEAIERAQVRAARNARERRRHVSEMSFEEFERRVYREEFEGGKYVVNGDTPILNRKQLREFFEKHVQQNPDDERSGSLIIHLEGGQRAIWSDAERQRISYCVSTSFGSRQAAVIDQMLAATWAWETVADVDFVHVASDDASCTAMNENVVFDVRPVDVGGQYLARAFFPNDPRPARNVLIDESAFQLGSGELSLEGILRHELGHTLGFRHEHTRPESGACFEDADWEPLTAYDAFSVMHYPQCNGAGDWSLELTHLDQNGAACLYGSAESFEIDTDVCQPEEDPISACSPQMRVERDQQVARGNEQDYPAFTVAAGTPFEARLNGSGSAPGDPDLYVRFGGPPDRSAGLYDCRPYLEGADETCSLDVPADASQAFVMVHGFEDGAYDLTVTFTSGGQP